MADELTDDRLGKIKVFVSYSRADSAFAVDLVAALQACGFEAFIDQEDIAPGEPWEQRLGGLIENSDTVVFVISPDSLSSEHCSWEVGETLRLNKRLLPVVFCELDDAVVPPELSSLNYTFFAGKNSFAIGLKELSSALRVDHEWIREHTRIGALARRWGQRGRSEALLLRGDELDTAARWLESRPYGAPSLTDEQVDLIAASKTARDTAERAARNRRRGLLIAVSSVAFVMAGLAAVSFFQWQSAEDAKSSAIQAFADLEHANTRLQGAYLRLSADLALRAPPTGQAPFRAAGGWFPVAANYSGAVTRLQKERQIVTGFLIDGSLVHPTMKDEPLLITPRFKSVEEVIEEDRRLNAFLAATEAAGAEAAQAFEGQSFSRAFVTPEDQEPNLPDNAEPDMIAQVYISEEPPIDAPGGPDMMEQRYIEEPPSTTESSRIIVSFPTLDKRKTYALEGEPIWRTPVELEAEPVFNVYRIGFDLPFGARAIQPSDLDCSAKKRTSKLGDRFALFGIDGLSASLQSEEELTLLVTDGLELSGSGEITYRHATLKGAYGAPLFDLETEKVIGIHLGVDANQVGPDGRVGFAEPLLPLIDNIRDDVSIERSDDARTPPLCGPS